MLWEAGLTKLIKFGGRQFNKVKGLAVLVVYDLYLPGIWLDIASPFGVLPGSVFSQLSTCTARADP